MPSRVNWNGPAWKQKRQTQLQAALTEINLRIEAEAKAELYPGHGKITGRLQRSITADAPVQSGNRLTGRIATKGVRYGRRINRLYRFFPIAIRRVRGQVPTILKKHVT